MKKSYFPENGIWLKGDIHSHSTVSDGLFTPEELVERHITEGYDFLSMTDHNTLRAHDDLARDNFLLLTGIEHDIEYTPDKCTHVVGLAAADKNSTDYPCKHYSAEELTAQQLIDMMRQDGQFISLAHPMWSHMKWEDILPLDGYHAREVYNNGTEHLCHGGKGETLWDLLLYEGKKVFATAVDDVHVPEDLYGGWVWVKAAERSKKAILDALFSGAYYSSCGPVIHDFGIEDGQVYISCSACREIHFVTYSRRGKSFFAKDGVHLTSAIFALDGTESYVRAVCVDGNGRSAWLNPIFFDKRA